AGGCPSAPSRRRATCGGRAWSSSATTKAARSAVSRCGFPFPDEQNGEQREQDEVTREHEPGRERREVEREVPVAEREPELRQQQCQAEQRRRRETAAAAHERHEGQAPAHDL